MPASYLNSYEGCLIPERLFPREIMPISEMMLMAQIGTAGSLWGCSTREEKGQHSALDGRLHGEPKTPYIATGSVYLRFTTHTLH